MLVIFLSSIASTMRSHVKLQRLTRSSESFLNTADMFLSC